MSVASTPPLQIQFEIQSSTPPLHNAYVTLSNANDTAQCLEKLNLKQYQNRSLLIHQIPTPQHLVSKLKNATNTVTIYNLKSNVTEQNVMDFIRQNGRVSKAPRYIYLRHHSDSKFPSFAVVECQSPKDATSLVTHLNLKPLKSTDNERVWVQYVDSLDNSVRRQWLRGSTEKVLLCGIHREIDEEQIRMLMSDYGTIKEVEFQYDALGYPRGAARVTMSSAVEACNAFDGAHGAVMKQCRLSTQFWTESETTSIVFRNVPGTIHEPHVWNLVGGALHKSSSKPLHIERVYDDEKKWKEIRVRLETEQDLETCIETLDGTPMGSVTLSVEPCPQIARAPHNVRDCVRWVRFSNLKSSVTEQDLLTHIERNGKIAYRPRTIIMFKNGNLINWPGWALVECVTPECATSLVEHLNLTNLGGARMWVTWTERERIKRNEHLGGKVKRVRLEQLHWSVTQEKLRGMVSAYGEVISVKVPMMNGYSQCVGIVEMDDEHTAETVFDALNGMECNKLKIRTCFEEKDVQKNLVNYHTAKKGDVLAKILSDKSKFGIKVFSDATIKTSNLKSKSSKIRRGSKRKAKGRTKR